MNEIKILRIPSFIVATTRKLRWGLHETMDAIIRARREHGEGTVRDAVLGILGVDLAEQGFDDADPQMDPRAGVVELLDQMLAAFDAHWEFAGIQDYREDAKYITLGYGHYAYIQSMDAYAAIAHLSQASELRTYESRMVLNHRVEEIRYKGDATLTSLLIRACEVWNDRFSRRVGSQDIPEYSVYLEQTYGHLMEEAGYHDRVLSSLEAYGCEIAERYHGMVYTVEVVRGERPWGHEYIARITPKE